MYIPILLSLLLAQGNSARFHPADADIFVELPNPLAFLESMQSAPLLDTLRDKTIRNFIEGFLDQDDLDLGLILDGNLLDSAPENVRGIFGGLESFGLSIRLGDGLSNSCSTLSVARFGSPQQAQGAFEFLSEGEVLRPIEDANWPGAVRREDSFGPDTWNATFGRFLLVGTDDLRNDKLKARLENRGVGLDTDQNFQLTQRGLDDLDVTPLLIGYLRRSPISLASEALMRVPDAPVEELQLITALDLLGGSHAVRIQRRDDRYVTECFSPKTKASDDLPAIGVGPIGAEPGVSIPADLWGFYVTRIDGDRLGAAFARACNLSAQRSDREDLLASLETDLGFPIARLFGHLGPRLSLRAKSIKGPAAPETVVWIDLKNPEEFAADLAAITDAVSARIPDFEARSRIYKIKNQSGERVPFSLTSLNLPREWVQWISPLSIQPAIAIAGDRLLVSFASTHVKRELKRVFGTEATAGMENESWNLTDLALPKEAVSASSVNWNNQIGALVDQLRAFASLAGDAMPFDADAIPPSEDFVKFFRPTVDYLVRRNGGTYRYHESSFGAEVLMASFGIVMTFAAQAQADLLEGMPEDGSGEW